jgi:hypothetical protein
MLGSTQGRRDGCQRGAPQPRAAATVRPAAATARRAAARRRAAGGGSGRGLDGVHVRHDRGHRVEDCLTPADRAMIIGALRDIRRNLRA